MACATTHKSQAASVARPMQAAGAFLSPVKIWYAIIKRIKGYPGANVATPVSTVWRNGNLFVTSQELVASLRAAVEANGEE